MDHCIPITAFVPFRNLPSDVLVFSFKGQEGDLELLFRHCLRMVDSRCYVQNLAVQVAGRKSRRVVRRQDALISKVLCVGKREDFVSTITSSKPEAVVAPKGGGGNNNCLLLGPR